MAGSREKSIRLLLLIAITVVAVATFFVRQKMAERQIEREVAAGQRPDSRAREALAAADQAVLDKDAPAQLAALERARTALDEALIEAPTEPKLLRSRLVVVRRLALLAADTGRTAEGQALLEEASSRAQALFEQDRMADRGRADLLQVARELAHVLRQAGAVGRAAQVLTEAAAAVESALSVLPGEAGLQADLAEVWLEAAEAQAAAEAPGEASKALVVGADRAENSTRGGEDPVAALARAHTLVARAARLAETLHHPETVALTRRAIRLLEEQSALVPDNPGVDRGLAQWQGRLADLAEAANDDAAALAAHQAHLALREKLLQQRPDDADARRERARAANSLGAWHSTQGRTEEAIARYREAADVARPLGDDRTRLVALGNLAQVLGRLDRVDEARTVAAEAYAIAVRLAGLPDSGVTGAQDAASAGLRHARLLRATPRPDRTAARAVTQTELDRLAALPGRKPGAVDEALEALKAELGR